MAVRGEYGKNVFEFYLVSSLVFDQSRLHFTPHTDMFTSGLVDQDVVFEGLVVGRGSQFAYVSQR